MADPRIIIVKDHGTNCEFESQYGWQLALDDTDDKKGLVKIVHMEDLIIDPDQLSHYQLMMFAGGFSGGDDTGSGNYTANRIKNHLWEEVLRFAEDEDKLMLGVCNGFQIMVNLGLLPALDGQYGKREAALISNDFPRYTDRWTDLKFEGNGPWTKGLLNLMMMPVAHGEGKFYADKETLKQINEKGMVAARYVLGEACQYQNMDANPNGSLENIAAITDESKRIMGMMPHPERAMFFCQLPNSKLLQRLCKREDKQAPKYGPGLAFFENAVKYFK